MMKNTDSNLKGIIRDYDLNRWSVRIGYAAAYLLGILFLVICFFPLIWTMLSGFKEIKEFVLGTKILPEEMRLSSYFHTWETLSFARYYINSGVSVGGSVLCAVFFNGLLGFVLSRVRPAGHKVVYALVMWGLLIPATTSIVPLFLNILKLHLTESFLPLWLSMGANAFYTVLFKNFFDSLPKPLIESARIDGASEFRIFRSIAVPLSQAVIMVVVLYSINAAWSDFLLPFLLLQNTPLETVMVKLFSWMRGSKFNDVQIIRAIVFSIIPPITLFALFQKQITQVKLQAGIKG
ncbi:MAG: carbohydrate ABC transporter permease [Spirochaetales bacterium]|nr:carbohydrate ABC transporter permease [Spirochaetales bacterium]